MAALYYYKLISKLKFNYFYITCMLLLFISCHSYANEPLSISIKKEFNTICRQQQFSGAMLIAKNGRVIFKQACGIANRSFNIPNDINTKFNLGSVGKLFTSVAIAQLVQQGKISLTTSVDSVIPSWLPEKDTKEINIGQLLTHTAGLGSFMDDKRWQLGADSGLYMNVNDYKPLIKSDTLLFMPGKSQNYSNNGYLLLGAIIENVEHTSYANYLLKNIFAQCQMSDTGIYPLDDPIANRAEGYLLICQKSKCHWKNNNYRVPFIGSPAGGAYSTITDLFKFSEALHHYKLLNSTFTRAVLSTEIIAPSQDIAVKPLKINNMIIPETVSPYGFAGVWNKYGFAVWNNPSLVGHTGGAAGVSAFFATAPDNQYTIIILSNTSGSAPIALYKKVRVLLEFPADIKNY